MKKVVVLILTLFFGIIFSCKSIPNFTEVTGKAWKLVEVQVNGASIGFNRSTLTSEGFGDIFTLTFDAERISGAGAPNRYFAPYTLDKNQAISIKTIGGTLMAPIRQPEKLKEQDYFNYLQSAYKWDLVNLNFILLTKDAAGAEVKLIYAL